jgi:DNA-binding helix-hairpin-helix protein with protein kinase domain
MMSSGPTQVTDAVGCRHKLGACLGRGGQGAVYEVKDTPFVVKLIDEAQSSRHDWLRNQLTFVKRLELRDLPIAQPLEMLREPHVGYVMELVTGMEPLSRLIEPPPAEPSIREWYRSNGGLRRRLRILARVADVLNGLHARGLIYGDLSAKNVFASADIACEEICLIDCDNIRYQSAPQSGDVYTVGYGPPELVLGRSPVNTLTEAYALAVLAFQVLTATHPLIGDYVHDGEPEREQEAFEGRLPWIDDPTSDLNRSRFGIDRSIVLSPRLTKLFEETFGPGLTNPLLRPGISRWVDRLHTAAESTVKCPQCASTYFPIQKCCPWCSSPKPRFVRLRFHLWDPAAGKGKEIIMSSDDKPLLAGGAILSDGDTLEISARLALGLDGVAGTRQVGSIRLDGDIAKIHATEKGPYRLVSQDAKQSLMLSTRPLPVPMTAAKDSWMLHFGPLDKLHRFAVFERRSEVRREGK